MEKILFCQQLANKIKKQMAKIGLTIQSLSKKSNVSVERIHIILSGQEDPTAWEIFCMADALRVGWGFFFFFLKEEISSKKVPPTRFSRRDSTHTRADVEC